MKRAAPTPKDKLIFALDVPDLAQALGYAEILKDHVGLFKIGLELFVKEGPGAVTSVREIAPNVGIFLDLKFHDIPATVVGAYRSAVDLGADFVTVHLSEGSPMIRAILGEGETGTTVLGVTVLTSTSADDLGDIGIDPEKFPEPGELVIHRAHMAKEAGLKGFVSSPLEVRTLKEALGDDIIVVTPGIRLAGSGKDDQKRIATPGSAIRDGADYLVVGRPIRDSVDPVKTAEEIVREIEEALL